MNTPIDRNAFATECVRAADQYGVDALYLLAVAELRSKISATDDGERFGPFWLTQSQWEAGRADTELDPQDIRDPFAQCRFFAAFTAATQSKLRRRLERPPTPAEIYLDQFEASPDEAQRIANDLLIAMDAIRPLIAPAAVDPDLLIRRSSLRRSRGAWQSQPETSLEAWPPRPANVAEFLFATDRARNPSSDTEPFGFARASALSFGAARVNVPDDDHHEIGRLELPAEYKLFGLTLYKESLDPKKHFIVESVEVIERTRFAEIARQNATRAALVFVHGFNTTFNDAVLRFAQIVWDMQYKGVPILYSWPSRGGVLNYLYDKESTLTSRPRFIELLQLLQSDAQIERIHILAHSMGNMIVLDALNQAASQFVARPLAEIMLAAPDVPQSAFADWVACLGKIARGVTLYASSEDRALFASRQANAGPRAGDVMTDGPMVLPGIDSIDVSAIGAEMFGLNHNVFATNRSLIDDIGRVVLTGQRPVNERSPQIRGMPTGTIPPRYWRYPK